MHGQSFIATRETKRVPTELEHVSLDGKFSGYASIFGAVDQSNDAVNKGAFSKTLRQRKPSDIRMLFQHDPDQPIGAWTRIEEDRSGLFVEGKISQGVEKGREVLSLLRDGALDGLSIGFKTVRAKVNPINGVRQILELDLWEISVVTFPLLENARISDVKSATRTLPSPREFERWLTRDAGLTRSEARTVISSGFRKLHCKQDAALEQSLATKIAMAATLFKSRK